MKNVLLVYSEQKPGDAMKDFTLGFDYIEDAQPFADDLAKRGIESQIYIGMIYTTPGLPIKEAVAIEAKPVTKTIDPAFNVTAE